ncbi:hypothetical protein GCM10010363_07810 [Streptomyces omiyaensis]|uniref:DUF732 domain-containing protein n=1 Tax=Streptomyces omiyaensis TaxID=68247 RepID=UPI001677D1D2|nr:DUF732 domain-containing protein [Streptomyces omiyaensis]GGY29781.1 hypothetical protein GCM10010363_07810 [Streptomyces omiyaensis]
MRRLTTALTASVLLALTACGSSETPTVDTKPAPTTTATPSPEEQFLADVEAADFESWKTKEPTSVELTSYATDWCTEFKAGHGVAYVLGDGGLYPNGMDWGTKKGEAQELIVLAVTAYCPEYRDQITQELRDSGTY